MLIACRKLIKLARTTSSSRFADINDAVDMLNEVAGLKAVLDLEEVQHALKVPAAYADAHDNFLAKYFPFLGH
jgi:hypothetical protein